VKSLYCASNKLRWTVRSMLNCSKKYFVSCLSHAYCGIQYTPSGFKSQCIACNDVYRILHCILRNVGVCQHQVNCFVRTLILMHRSESFCMTLFNDTHLHLTFIITFPCQLTPTREVLWRSIFVFRCISPNPCDMDRESEPNTYKIE